MDFRFRSNLLERYSNDTRKGVGWISAYQFFILPIAIALFALRAYGRLAEYQDALAAADCVVLGCLVLNFWFLLSLDSFGYIATIVTASVVAARYLADVILPLLLGKAISEEIGPSIVGVFVSAFSAWLIFIEVLTYIVIFALLFLHTWYFVRRKDLFYKYHTEELKQVLKAKRDAASRGQGCGTSQCQSSEHQRGSVDKEALELARRQAEWDRTHGRFDYKVAGVTYDNEDGTSRQKYLMQIKKALGIGESINLQHVADEYNGETCIKVMFDDKCVGFVPKHKIDEFTKIANQIECAHPEINSFTDEYQEDDGSTTKEKIYYCHVYLTYRK